MATDMTDEGVEDSGMFPIRARLRDAMNRLEAARNHLAIKRIVGRK